jgi:hypothetical protein
VALDCLEKVPLVAIAHERDTRTYRRFLGGKHG